MQESSAFLKAINLIGVNEQTGEALLAGVNGPIASRTNTAAGNRRNPADVSQLTKDVYACKQTNFDTAFPYALLDAWAKFPDFQVRLTNAIIERQSLDRIMIGFNGTSAALATDRANNPLLQDVNKGWLQKIREGAADHVMDEGAVAGKVTVGGTKVIKVAGVDTGISGDYQTLDGLVFDAIQMLAPWHRSRPDLVVLVSRNLMHESSRPWKKAQPPTRKRTQHRKSSAAPVSAACQWSMPRFSRREPCWSPSSRTSPSTGRKTPADAT